MHRVFLLLLISVILVSSFLVYPPKLNAGKTHSIARWNEVGIPGSEDLPGSILAPGSDVLQILSGINGTVEYAVLSGDGNRLYASRDGGNSWQESGHIFTGFIDMCTSPANENIIYYSTEEHVYRSVDGGQSFSPLANLPGIDDNITITSIDVISRQGEEFIAAGTRDLRSGEHGGIYILTPGRFLARWQDAGLTGLDVFAVKFLSAGGLDLELAAIGANGKQSIMTIMAGNTGWGNVWDDVVLSDSAGLPLPELEGASISPVEGSVEDEHLTFIAALDTGVNNGDVYRVNMLEGAGSSQSVSLDAGSAMGLDSVDISSLETSGSNVIIAGAALSSQVILSKNQGYSWEVAAKPPTGEGVTSVNITNNGYYAATRGAESGLSFSQQGRFWDQSAFVDTAIDAIVDFAPSPDYPDDGALYLLTWGGQASLWKSEDGGNTWKRSFSSAGEDIVDVKLLAISPDYHKDNQVVFMAGSSISSPAVWKSVDGGLSFQKYDAPAHIDAWSVAGDNELFFSSFDGLEGRVYHSVNSGNSFKSSPVSSVPLHSLSLPSDYAQTGAVLAGDINGYVYLSEDNGETFKPAGNSSELSGGMTVAFDNNFSDNSRIYAASDEPGVGIFRLNTSNSNRWQRIGDGFPAGGMIGSLAASDSGVLYAANYQQVDAGAGQGGVIRLLEPGKEQICTDTMLNNLIDSSTIWNIWADGESVWAIDTTYGRLLYYEDRLIMPPVLVFPVDGSGSQGLFTENSIKGITIDWEPKTGATAYRWQVSTSPAFTGVDADLEGATTASRINPGHLDVNSGYYWRVRTVSPVHSLWSDPFFFTTTMGGGVEVPVLESPSAGAQKVVLRPLFQWRVVDGAGSYELVLSTEPTFSRLVIEQTGTDSLPANAWQSHEPLDHQTSYFWKIRALGEESSSAWSAVGSFTTVDAEQNPPVPPEETTKPVKEPLVTTVICTPEITVTSPAVELPLQTIVVSVPPPEMHLMPEDGTPWWAICLMAGMGAVILVLIMMLAVVVGRKP